MEGAPEAAAPALTPLAAIGEASTAGCTGAVTGETGASTFPADGLHSSTTCPAANVWTGAGLCVLAGADVVMGTPGTTATAATTGATGAADSTAAALLISVSASWTGNSGCASFADAFFETRFAAGFFAAGLDTSAGFDASAGLEAFVALARGFVVRFFAVFFVSLACSSSKGCSAESVIEKCGKSGRVAAALADVGE